MIAGLLVTLRRAVEKEVLPEGSGIDPAVFEETEGEVLGVDVVYGEEAGNAVFLGEAGDEAGHPVVVSHCAAYSD